MKFFRFFILPLMVTLVTSCEDNSSTSMEEETIDKTVPQQEFAIAIHGGAGDMIKGQMSDSLENEYSQKLKEAITEGHTILKNGGSAIDAVKATLTVLEDSPLFNAGKGAVLNHEEKPELDASIMDGETLNAGAVAGVQHIKNPIHLALEVMNHSRHVFLAGEGAEYFALERGFKLVPESYFITPERLNEIRNIKGGNASVQNYDPYIKNKKMGTVGCVALDKKGNLAAGTSTGGISNKRFGRIGDSPVIGAGTYANNKTCAVSCTGAGEFYIRGVVAYDMSALMEYKKLSVFEATHKIIHEKQIELGGTGGIIAMDHYGNVSMDFNTLGMFRARMDDKGEMTIGIYRDDEVK